MSSQPIHLRRLPDRSTADAAHRRRDLHRLLTQWWALNARLITARAHGVADDLGELADTVAAIEDTLDFRHPLTWQVVEPDLNLALLEAEHLDRSTSSVDCSACHRLGDGLPSSVRQLIGMGQAQ